MSDNNAAMMGAGMMEGGSSSDNANELTQLVQQMLTQMQTRFQSMSDNIISRIDEMGTRIDDLEKSIADLVQEAQADSDQAARNVEQHQQNRPGQGGAGMR